MERVVRDGLSPQVRREVAALTVLRHRRLVEGVDFRASGDQLFLVMELVSGGDLYELLVRERRLPEARAQRLGWQICEGLTYCHGQGVYHRDLKVRTGGRGGGVEWGGWLVVGGGGRLGLEGREVASSADAARAAAVDAHLEGRTRVGGVGIPDWQAHVGVTQHAAAAKGRPN
ncbi:hypothetical protein BU14_0306s0014 [Porphyra umbilicalis]|uniref:Protein kinase domain-containing protein n=1 Tax=Porphyra umbilicalis TaxID=2786 RepID=A0A1X6P031_PORUM|nr:hypothetical protein BU14_0306s0014 [Porphyra umbilicalis]|eukprot:OSX74135.1 hypothetical protein BU14_0306s0014 [Porphyra umbilicalis]